MSNQDELTKAKEKAIAAMVKRKQRNHAAKEELKDTLETIAQSEDQDLVGPSNKTDVEYLVGAVRITAQHLTTC